MSARPTTRDAARTPSPRPPTKPWTSTPTRPPPPPPPVPPPRPSPRPRPTPTSPAPASPRLCFLELGHPRRLLPGALLARTPRAPASPAPAPPPPSSASRSPACARRARRRRRPAALAPRAARRARGGRRRRRGRAAGGARAGRAQAPAPPAAVEAGPASGIRGRALGLDAERFQAERREAGAARRGALDAVRRRLHIHAVNIVCAVDVAKAGTSRRSPDSPCRSTATSSLASSSVCFSGLSIFEWEWFRCSVSAEYAKGLVRLTGIRDHKERRRNRMLWLTFGNDNHNILTKIDLVHSLGWAFSLLAHRTSQSRLNATESYPWPSEMKEWRRRRRPTLEFTAAANTPCNQPRDRNGQLK